MRIYEKNIIIITIIIITAFSIYLFSDRTIAMCQNSDLKKLYKDNYKNIEIVFTSLGGQEKGQIIEESKVGEMFDIL